MTPVNITGKVGYEFSRQYKKVLDENYSIDPFVMLVINDKIVSDCWHTITTIRIQIFREVMAKTNEKS